jgi:hypothetical protein
MVWFVQTLGQFVAVYLSNEANKPTESEQWEFWREFVGVYHGLPDLWKVKSDGYKDQIKKDTAYKIGQVYARK